MRKSEVFASKEEFDRIYSDLIDEKPSADKAVMKRYQKMGYALDDYISAIEEDTFRYAYECGYKAALAKTEKGGAA